MHELRNYKKMPNNIHLPKPHFSWSQLNMWETSPKQYEKRYIFGEQIPINNAMRFGKTVSEALETEQTDDPVMQALIDLAPKFNKAEHEIRVVHKMINGNVELFGIVDSFNTKTKHFREYKTGKNGWTQAMVDKFGQITFYNYMLYLQHGKIPEKCYLDWFETEHDYGQVKLTGRIETFETSRNMLQILEMGARISKAVKNISKLYAEHLPQL